jgi:hypothetical protein
MDGKQHCTNFSIGSNKPGRDNKPAFPFSRFHLLKPANPSPGPDLVSQNENEILQKRRKSRFRFRKRDKGRPYCMRFWEGNTMPISISQEAQQATGGFRSHGQPRSRSRSHEATALSFGRWRLAGLSPQAATRARARL